MYQPESKEEAAFLAAYDPSKYKNPAVAVDLTVFGYSKREKTLKALMVRRKNYPYRGWYSFPGGFMEIDEHIDCAVRRELEEETGLKDVYAELYYVMGDPDRDPRQRVVTPEYFSLVDMERVRPQAGDDAAEAEWFTLSAYGREEVVRGNTRQETFRLTLSGCGRTFSPVLYRETVYQDAIERREKVLDTGGIAFDHSQVAFYSLWRLQERLKNSDVAYNALPQVFSLEELEDLYQAAFLPRSAAKEAPGLRQTAGGYTFLPEEKE